MTRSSRETFQSQESLHLVKQLFQQLNHVALQKCANRCTNPRQRTGPRPPAVQAASGPSLQGPGRAGPAPPRAARAQRAAWLRRTGRLRGHRRRSYPRHRRLPVREARGTADTPAARAARAKRPRSARSTRGCKAASRGLQALRGK